MLKYKFRFLIQIFQIGILLYGGLFLLPLTAQEKDLKLWTDITISKDIFKKLNLSLTEEAKFGTNISRFDQLVSEVNLKYSIIKGVKARITYRYTTVNSLTNGWYSKQRVAFALFLDKDIYRFNIGLRPEYQIDYKGFVNEAKDELLIKHLRTKLELEYNIRKTPLTPFISYELFYNFYALGKNYFDEDRLVFGASYKYKKRNEFELYYMINRELNSAYPGIDYVFGISYQYKFK